MKKLKKQIPNILLVISSLLILSTFIFPFHKEALLEVVVSFVLIYVGFSLLHHHLDKTMRVELALEYVLIASLVLIIIVSAY